MNVFYYLMKQNKVKNIFLIALILISVLSIDAQTVRDQFNNGKRYFNQKNYPRAKKSFTYVVNHNKAYSEAYTYRARIYMIMEMPDSALRDFNTSIDIQKDFIPNYYYRARLYYSQKEYEKAEKDLTFVIDNKPEFDPALFLRAKIYEINGYDDYAVKDYNQLIANGTKNYMVYYKRGIYLSKNRKNSAAIKDFEKTLSYKYNFVDALYALGNSHQVLGHHQKAIKYFSDAINLDNSYQKAYEKRALSYYSIKNYEKGVADDRYLNTRFKIKNDTLYIRMANAEKSMSNFIAADRYLAKATSVNPKSTDALLLRAEVAIELERESTAISYLKKIHRIDPKNDEAWFMQGEILYGAKKYSEAINAFTSCVRINNMSKAYYYRGIVYSSLRDNKNACKDIRKAADLGYLPAKRDVKSVCR